MKANCVVQVCNDDGRGKVVYESNVMEGVRTAVFDG